MNETVIPARKETKNIIFLFHGYGSDKDDLYPIGKTFANTISTLEVHIPNGLEICPEAGNYRWFPLEGNDVNLWGKELAQSEREIMNYINDIIKQRSLKYEDIILSGFSQGAMLSLSLGIFYNVKAVISFSGLLLNPEKYLRRANTKIFLSHGKNDQVIPIDALNLTRTALENTSIETSFAISENAGHGIDDYLLTQAVDFLKSL